MLFRSPPRVDLAARKAMEATTAAWAAEKKKKRSAAEVGQYELKKMKRGNRVDSLREVAARVKVEVALTVCVRVILLGIPSLDVANANFSRLICS